MAGEIIMKQNLHTHSIYCDGKDTIEEMVQEAISRNFDVLGFSGHGHCAIDTCSMSKENTQKYIHDVLAAKKKYQDKISIHLGIEQDMLGRLETKEPFEYVIGSKHFLKNRPIDHSKEKFIELFEYYHHDFISLCKDYYTDLSNMANWSEVDIIGHLDLITKFNEDESFWRFEDEKYVSIVCDCIDRLIGANKIMEINTGAIARGYRTTPYPYKNLLEYINAHQGRICLNSDCHDKTKLDCAYDVSLDLIRSCGFKEMDFLTDQGFQKRKVEN